VDPEKSLRADARRNHERVLDAAAEVFAERGKSAPIAEIARRAGVGAATLFRRFPTKQALLLAVVVRKLERLAAEAQGAVAEDDVAAGIRSFFVAACLTSARDQVLLELAHQTISDPRLDALQAEIFASIAELAERGRAAGLLRPDIEAHDLAVLMNAIAFGVRDLTDTKPDVHLRYIEVVLAGLRPDSEGHLLPSSAPHLETPGPRRPSAS
jgi:AcrR family transcriptional regulator